LTLFFTEKGHSEDCNVTTEKDLAYDTSYQRKRLLNSDVEMKCIKACVKHLSKCHGESNRILRAVIDVTLSKSKIDTKKILPAIYTSIINKAQVIDKEGVAPKDQVRVFLQKLRDMGITEPLIQRNPEGAIIAISWSDPSVRLDKDAKFSLLSFDCIDGMLTGHCSKLSAITGITPDGTAEVLQFTVLIHETMAVFTKEIQYLVDTVDPSLFSPKITCMTDKDYGRIGAIREVMK
jgi:hypothetical protein